MILKNALKDSRLIFQFHNISFSMLQGFQIRDLILISLLFWQLS